MNSTIKFCLYNTHTHTHQFYDVLRCLLSFPHRMLAAVTSSFCHGNSFVCVCASPISYRDKSYSLKLPCIGVAATWYFLLLLRLYANAMRPYCIIAASSTHFVHKFFSACFTICNFAHGIVYSSNGKIVLSLYFSFFLDIISITVFVGVLFRFGAHIAKRSSFGRVNEISYTSHIAKHKLRFLFRLFTVYNIFDFIWCSTFCIIFLISL